MGRSVLAISFEDAIGDTDRVASRVDRVVVGLERAVFNDKLLISVDRVNVLTVADERVVHGEIRAANL